MKFFHKPSTITDECGHSLLYKVLFLPVFARSRVMTTKCRVYDQEICVNHIPHYRNFVIKKI